MLACPLQHMLKFGEHQSPAYILVCLGGFKSFSFQRLHKQSDSSGPPWLLSFHECEFVFEHNTLGWVGFKHLGELYLDQMPSKAFT